MHSCSARVDATLVGAMCRDSGVKPSIRVATSIMGAETLSSANNSSSSTSKRVTTTLVLVAVSVEHQYFVLLPSPPSVSCSLSRAAPVTAHCFRPMYVTPQQRNQQRDFAIRK